jgi:hypothetical protein
VLPYPFVPWPVTGAYNGTFIILKKWNAGNVDFLKLRRRLDINVGRRPAQI